MLIRAFLQGKSARKVDGDHGLDPRKLNLKAHGAPMPLELCPVAIYTPHFFAGHRTPPFIKDILDFYGNAPI